MLSYDDLTERFVHWAQGQPDLRAILIIGSRARTPPRYLERTDWLGSLPTG